MYQRQEERKSVSLEPSLQESEWLDVHREYNLCLMPPNLKDDELKEGEVYVSINLPDNLLNYKVLNPLKEIKNGVVTFKDLAERMAIKKISELNVGSDLTSLLPYRKVILAVISKQNHIFAITTKDVEHLWYFHTQLSHFSTTLLEESKSTQSDSLDVALFSFYQIFLLGEIIAPNEPPKLSVGVYSLYPQEIREILTEIRNNKIAHGEFAFFARERIQELYKFIRTKLGPEIQQLFEYNKKLYLTCGLKYFANLIEDIHETDPNKFARYCNKIEAIEKMISQQEIIDLVKEEGGFKSLYDALQAHLILLKDAVQMDNNQSDKNKTGSQKYAIKSTELRQTQGYQSSLLRIQELAPKKIFYKKIDFEQFKFFLRLINDSCSSIQTHALDFVTPANYYLLLLNEKAAALQEASTRKLSISSNDVIISRYVARWCFISLDVITKKEIEHSQVADNIQTIPAIRKKLVHNSLRYALEDEISELKKAHEKFKEHVIKMSNRPTVTGGGVPLSKHVKR